MLLSRAFLRKRPGQHEFGLENRPAARDNAIKGRTHPPEHRMPEAVLDAFDGLPGIALVPMAVESFCCEAKFNDEGVGEGLRLGFAPVFPPEGKQGRPPHSPFYSGLRARQEGTGFPKFGE